MFLAVKNRDERIKQSGCNRQYDLTPQVGAFPTDKKDAADSFISDKSTTLTKGLISCAILFAAYIVIALVMPSILSWISGFISK